MYKLRTLKLLNLTFLLFEKSSRLTRTGLFARGSDSFEKHFINSQQNRFQLLVLTLKLHVNKVVLPF